MSELRQQLLHYQLKTVTHESSFYSIRYLAGMCKLTSALIEILSFGGRISDQIKQHVRLEGVISSSQRVQVVRRSLVSCKILANIFFERRLRFYKFAISECRSVLYFFKLGSVFFTIIQLANLEMRCIMTLKQKLLLENGSMLLCQMPN